MRMDIFGSVYLEAHRTQGLPSTPFVDTETVTATVTFGDCLTGYYDAHPEWAPDGSKGAHVAEAWLDVMCDRFVYQDVFKCEPTGHEWKPGAGPNGRHQMSVHYDALDPELDNFDVRIGPIAREELAGCEPTVDVGFESLDGFASDALVWEIDPVFSESAWGGPTSSTKTNDPDPVKAWVWRP